MTRCHYWQFRCAVATTGSGGSLPPRPRSATTPWNSTCWRAQIRIVRCLEALYAWERNDDDWLRASMKAVGAVWERSVWTCGILYDASNADAIVQRATRTCPHQADAKAITVTDQPGDLPSN
jgi:hypothetical protein